MGRAYRRCKVPLVPAPLNLGGDVVELLRALIDIESVSGQETEIADRVEQALRRYDHLKVSRDGNVVLARTELGSVRAGGDRRPPRHRADRGKRAVVDDT